MSVEGGSETWAILRSTYIFGGVTYIDFFMKWAQRIQVLETENNFKKSK